MVGYVGTDFSDDLVKDLVVTGLLSQMDCLSTILRSMVRSETLWYYLSSTRDRSLSIRMFVY